MSKYKHYKILQQVILILVFVILGVLYLSYSWTSIENEKIENLLLLSKSIEASLPKEDISKLDASPNDVEKSQYRLIKNILIDIIRINNNARFAYLYTQKNNKIYFMVDSEPEDSKDYSPPGQEYTEANLVDKQPFNDGKAIVTGSLKDRWGTWKSALIPIKDKTTGKIIAVFGLDFNARYWRNLIQFAVFKYGVFVFLFLTLIFFSVKIKVQNINLKNEIIQRKQAEGIIQQQNQELQALNKTKDKFFSIIAHDLKSPFNTLLGYTELLAQNIRNYNVNTIQQIVEDLHSSTVQTYRLLENLLDWSLNQRNRIAFNPEKKDLWNIGNEIVNLLKPTAEAKNISLFLEIKSPFFVYADTYMLNAILRNLISNAIKFTQTGGFVKIEAKYQNSMILVSVTDNGVGIQPESVSKLFRIETNISQKGTSGEKGTGLGLMLCKEFVEKHGGEIWVESEIENLPAGKAGGSTFYFTLKKNDDTVI